MNGNLLALGTIGALALGAATRRAHRGGANTRGTANVGVVGWPDSVPYALRMRAADIAERVQNDTRRGREGFPRRVPREMGTYLGEGETRIVYALDPNFVVKLPQDRHRKGFNQNEAAIWTKAPPGLRELLVPVLAADPSGAWLIMPRIRSRLDDAEYRRAQQLCDAVERYVTTRYSDCEEGQNVGARADGQLFLFDYPFDPDDIPDDIPDASPQGSRATIPLPASFPPTEVGLLTRAAFLSLRNPDAKIHNTRAYDLPLAEMNESLLRRYATHTARNAQGVEEVYENRRNVLSLWIPPQPSGTPDPDPVRKAILRDKDGTFAVLEEGILYHAHRIRPQDIPREWRKVGDPRLWEPVQLGVDRTQVTKYLVDQEKRVWDDTAHRRARYNHLLQRIVIQGARYEIRAQGVPTPNEGVSLVVLDAEGQKVAHAVSLGVTLIQVAQEMWGRGLGPLLTRVWYDLNPDSTSGGFTPRGQNNALRVWAARVREFQSRGWYSALVQQGRMTAAQARAIQAGVGGKSKPSPFPAALPQTDSTPEKHQLLVYVNGGAWVLYDSRFLTDPHAQWIRGYGLFEDGLRGTFVYRIDYEPTHRVLTTLIALQLARDEGWPIYVGPGYGDLLELEGLEDRILREGDRIRLRSDALPLRDMARLETLIRRKHDPHGVIEGQLLEEAEGKWT